MKVKIQLLLLLLCFSLFTLITSCNRHDNNINGLWLSTQVSISEDYSGELDRYGVYYFHDDNTLDLGNYDYSSKDYNNNYNWVEEGIEYEWIDENTIDIKYMESNVFKVSMEGSKLTLESENYSIDFERGKIDNSWVAELGYMDEEIHELTFNFKGNRGCPEVPVMLNNKEHRLIFDTGCGSGIALTNVIDDQLDYDLIGTVEQLNRDGSHRGWSKHVLLKELNVFGSSYKKIETVIVDWSMISSQEFNGLIGLEYFDSKIITLDYTGNKMGISDRAIDYSNLNKDKYVVLPLHKASTKGQETLPFFEAKYNDESVIVYLDTGKNHSYLYKPSSNSSMGRNVKSFTSINIELENLHLALTEIGEVNDISQAQGLPYPTMIELNSDQIWNNNLLVTFDLIEDNIIFHKR